MSDVAALCRGTRRAARAARLAEIVASILPVRALALGSLARCEDGWADNPLLLDRARAHAHAAAAYFRGDGSRRDLPRSDREVWTTLPFVADDERARGVLVVATEAALEEDGVAFLAFVARELALLAKRRGPGVAAAIANRRRETLVDETLATVSHDLKSPIGAILMNASLVLRRMPEAERRATGRPQVEAIVRLRDADAPARRRPARPRRAR